MTRTNISTLPTFIAYLSYHTFVKDYMFEATVHYLPRGTHTGIVAQYCEHHNMFYIYLLTSTSPWNCDLAAINSNDSCIIITGRKKPTTVQHVLETISSQQLTGECNRLHIIVDCRDKNILRKNLQENRSTFNKIRNMQSIVNKLITLPTKPTTTDRIGDIIQIPLQSDW